MQGPIETGPNSGGSGVSGSGGGVVRSDSFSALDTAPVGASDAVTATATVGLDAVAPQIGNAIYDPATNQARKLRGTVPLGATGLRSVLDVKTSTTDAGKNTQWLVYGGSSAEGGVWSGWSSARAIATLVHTAQELQRGISAVWTLAQLNLVEGRPFVLNIVRDATTDNHTGNGLLQDGTLEWTY